MMTFVADLSLQGTGHKVQGGGVGHQNPFKWRWLFNKGWKASGPPHYILQNQEHLTPCDCGKKHSCHRHVMQWHDCWSLETLQNEDSIKEGNVLDNATYLTVSQYFNQNLRSPLYSDLPIWLNLKPGGYGSKNFPTCRGEKHFLTPCWGVWDMLPQKILKTSVLRLAENAFPTL